MYTRGTNWNGSHWIRPDKRLAIYLRDQFRCTYCNRNLANAPARKRTLDHVIPVARGGDNDEANLCTACTDCNERKNNKTAWEYITKPAVADRLRRLIATPINRALAKAILAGTIDLSDVLKEQTQ